MRPIMVAAVAWAVIGFIGSSGTAHAQNACTGEGQTVTAGSVACIEDSQQKCVAASWENLNIPCHEVVVGREGMVVVTEDDEAKMAEGYTLCCAGIHACLPACGWCINGCAGHACKDGAVVLECKK